MEDNLLDMVKEEIKNIAGDVGILARKEWRNTKKAGMEPVSRAERLRDYLNITPEQMAEKARMSPDATERFIWENEKLKADRRLRI